MTNNAYRYTLYERFIHMGLAAFGIFAYLTAEGAEHNDGGLAYQLHAYLGLAVMAFVLLRILKGVTGSSELRFSSWSPFSKTQWLQALADVKSLAQLKLPEQGMHGGIAGLVQAFGLMIFAWMAATGTALYFIDESSNGMLFELFEETHEVGEELIPLFLLLHVGAVIAHSLLGKPNWQKMWRLDK